jgi:hypothetical protein
MNFNTSGSRRRLLPFLQPPTAARRMAVSFSEVRSGTEAPWLLAKANEFILVLVCESFMITGPVLSSPPLILRCREVRFLKQGGGGLRAVCQCYLFKFGP